MEQRSSATERLARENPRFRSLQEKHREFEARLDELRSQRWLSEADKLEEVKLKKLKLSAKDEMEALLREPTAD